MPIASTVFVDTNILVYSDDGREPQKREVARRWLGHLWQQRTGRLSTQVLNEYYAVVTRKLRPAMERGDARAEVRRYQLWNPWSIDQQTVETAWSIEARYGLSWWDTLILASAAHAGCRFVLSEDMQHGMEVDRLQVINPFLSDLSVLTA
jgi:predicted nucleic acid-binding protein